MRDRLKAGSEDERAKHAVREGDRERAPHRVGAVRGLLIAAAREGGRERESHTFASGPCGVMMEWREAPPGEKAPAFASYAPVISPMNSDMQFRWKYGGLAHTIGGGEGM